MLPLLLFATSCCTKKECEFSVRPDLSIHVQGFTKEEKENSQLYRYNVSNPGFMDSVTVYQDYYDAFSDIYLADSIFWYVIRIGDRKDTIDNIRFDVITETVRCNSCFPPGTGSGKEERTRYVNLRYDLNGVTFPGNEIRIVK